LPKSEWFIILVLETLKVLTVFYEYYIIITVPSSNPYQFSYPAKGVTERNIETKRNVTNVLAFSRECT
jgi:hypothetical protein